MFGAISSEENNYLKNSVIKFTSLSSDSTIVPTFSLLTSGFFGFFDFIFLMASWHLFESSLHFSISFMTSSICLFVPALKVYLILLRLDFFVGSVRLAFGCLLLTLRLA